MKTNLDLQQRHYNSTRKERLEKYRKSPLLLKGIARPLPYFKPYKLIVDEIIKEFKQNPLMHMLELGCGDGTWAVYWANQGFDITILDSSLVNVAIASLRSKVNNLEGFTHPFVGSATNLPWSDSSFDLIVGFAMVHHLTPNEEKCLWAELKRVLKPGGIAFFMESIENSTALEFLRTLIPITQRHNPRPSRFSKHYVSFVRNDPHPKRDNTTLHYVKILQDCGFNFTYEEVGIFSRLDRLTTNYKVRSFIHSFDYLIFKHIPFVRFFSRNIILKIVNPL